MSAKDTAQLSSNTRTIAQVEKQREQSTSLDAEQESHRVIVKKDHRLEFNPPKSAAVVLEPASSSLPIVPDLPQEPAITKADTAAPTAMPTFEKPVESPKKPSSPSFNFANDIGRAGARVRKTVQRVEWNAILIPYSLHFWHSGSTVSLVKATAKAPLPQPLQRNGSNCFKSGFQ